MHETEVGGPCRVMLPLGDVGLVKHSQLDDCLSSLSPDQGEKIVEFEYSRLPGYFIQDDPNDEVKEIVGEDATGKTARYENFGLIAQEYVDAHLDCELDDRYKDNSHALQWVRLRQHLHRLNQSAIDLGQQVQYKILFVSRHGEGYHNVVHAHSGDLFPTYWARLDNTRQHFERIEQGETGNPAEPTTVPDNIQIFEPYLTPMGQEQIRKLSNIWRTSGAPLPDVFYVSPLRRCLHTAWLTFAEAQEIQGPFARNRIVFNLKESIRARLGQNTNDRRNSRAWIQANFGSAEGVGWDDIKTEQSKNRSHTPVELEFEPDFSHDEIDLPWTRPIRETNEEMTERVRLGLNEIVAECFDQEKMVISVTSHSSAIISMCRVLGRPGRIALPTGQVVPFVVKVSRKER